MSASIADHFVPHASIFLDEPGNRVQRAVDSILPAMLAGVAKKSADPDGMTQILAMLDSAELDSERLGNLADTLSSAEKASGLIGLGHKVLVRLFAGKISGMESAVSLSTGLRPASSTHLLAMAAPMVLAFLKRHRDANRLDPVTLGQLLSSQGKLRVDSLEPRLASAMGFGPTLPRPAASVDAGVPDKPHEPIQFDLGSMRNWVTWIGIGAVAAAGLLLLLPSREPTVGAMSRTDVDLPIRLGAWTLPDGTTIEAPREGFMGALVEYLNGTDWRFKSFAFDQVRFETGSAMVTAASMKQIEQLAAVLRAYPQVSVNIEAHTDNAGSLPANKLLSADRAGAIGVLLEHRGVVADRITSVGFGAERPIVLDNAEIARAKNNRVELRVTSR